MTKRKQIEPEKFLVGLGLGAALGYVLAQLGWVQFILSLQSPRRTLAKGTNRFGGLGRLYERREEKEDYEIIETVENGIERVHYKPKNRRFETPLLFAHGMWHGAWCWEWWQALFAGWGWESVAYSLPGHAGSPEQRPIRGCTLDYYLSFVKTEAERLPRKPVLIGHSMGGALAQWYLKYVGDDLPAAVLAAPWPHRVTLIENGLRSFGFNDPLGSLQMFLDWSATPLVRTPESAARLLIGPKAVLTPHELHIQLGPESALVLFQHMAPHWKAPEDVQTPLLLIAGENDSLLTVEQLRDTADFYGADFYMAPGSGHNVQMDGDYAETARQVHHWLQNKGVV